MIAYLQDTDLSEQKMMKIYVRFIKGLEDVDLYHLPIKITQAEIIKAVTSDKTITKLKTIYNILNRSIFRKDRKYIH